jgi:hypothetical protein
VLHAAPHAAQVHRVYAVEVLGRLIGGVARRYLDAGVVEGHVEPAEGRHGSIDHRRDLGLVGDVASDGERPPPGRVQPLRHSLQRGVVKVGEDDGRARLGEGLRRCQSYAGPGASHERDLPAEVVGRTHRVSP